MMDRRSILQAGASAAVLASLPGRASAQAGQAHGWVDLNQDTGELRHIWSECAGSDRAAITLRESWRKDAVRWRGEAGLKRVRFHGIFADELGVWAPSIQNFGRPEAPNFQNVDQVYDGLCELGLSPLIELSFMPQKLASGTAGFGFYKGNITPPKSIEEWSAFITRFASHLVNRYGISVVKDWPMEVWNEPNLKFFWTGGQQDYFDFYKATAVAIKSVDERLQVGGPATSGTAWLPQFADYCAQNNAPVDFISTHCYAGDDQAELFGTDLHLRQADVIPEAVRRAAQQIGQSRLAGKPLWITEWSSDSPAVIAHVIANCLPHCSMMSHWTLSGTYEELGVQDFVLKEGDAGFGAVTRQIAKPAFNTYALLNRLGTRRLASEGPVLASRGHGSSVAVMLWNLADVQAPSGIPGISRTRTVVGNAQRVSVEFRGAKASQKVLVRFVDQERGSPYPAWRAMGSPQYPTPQQLVQLRQAAEIAPPVTMQLDASRVLTLDLPPEGVALVEMG